MPPPCQRWEDKDEVYWEAIWAGGARRARQQERCGSRLVARSPGGTPTWPTDIFAFALAWPTSPWGHEVMATETATVGSRRQRHRRRIRSPLVAGELGVVPMKIGIKALRHRGKRQRRWVVSPLGLAQQGEQRHRRIRDYTASHRALRRRRTDKVSAWPWSTITISMPTPDPTPTRSC